MRTLLIAWVYVLVLDSLSLSAFSFLIYFGHPLAAIVPAIALFCNRLPEEK